MQHAYITINGHPYPQPHRGLGMRVATIVDSARNANAVLVGQRVGRDQAKIENLEWAYLPAETWRSILREFETSFVATVTYPDMVSGTWVTRKMYPGDRTARPMWLDDTGMPTAYIECKVNLIDTGE